MVIVHLLAEYHVEFRILALIRVFEFRSEDNHDAVLEEVVELHGVGVHSLVIEVMGSKKKIRLKNLEEDRNSSLFVVHLDLEANDIAILDFALREGHLRLHELDHPRFDFLRGNGISRCRF